MLIVGGTAGYIYSSRLLSVLRDGARVIFLLVRMLRSIRGRLERCVGGIFAVLFVSLLLAYAFVNEYFVNASDI